MATTTEKAGMMQFPKTFAAAKRAESSQWAIADALLEEIGKPTSMAAKQSERFETCSHELKAAGFNYAVSTLYGLRGLAHAFPADKRPAGLTIEKARKAGDMKTYAKAEKMAADEGVPLSKRYVENVRKTTRSMDRAHKPMPTPKTPKPTRPAASERPTSEIRRHANVLHLHALAGEASKAGKQFVQAIAGFELSDDEREELLEAIGRTIEVWKVASNAVKKPLSTEVEDYLRSMS